MKKDKKKEKSAGTLASALEAKKSGLKTSYILSPVGEEYTAGDYLRDVLTKKQGSNCGENH